jgi:hypothetical protein
VLRAALALAAASTALAVPLSTASADRSHSAVTGTITLRVRYHGGPWKRGLSITLHKLRLTAFTVCAKWNYEAGHPFDCDSTEPTQLPSGTILRLEQNPVAKALKRPESPGWGMLGASPDGSLGAVLSNEVTGNRRGTFRYRVTLRDRSTDDVLATSNLITTVWR